MTADLSKQPNYHGLISALAEKTKALKLDWKPTASQGTYFAAVQGLQTYRIVRSGDSIRLTVSGPEGQKLLEIDGVHSTIRPLSNLELMARSGIARLEGGRDKSADIIKEASPLGQLFDLAQRVADGVDSAIEESIRILENL